MQRRSDRPVYLDNHATTPLDPRVLAAYVPTCTPPIVKLSGPGPSSPCW